MSFTIGSSAIKESSVPNLSADLAARIGILATVGGISAFTVANTALFSVPPGKTCVVTGYIVRVTDASGVSAGPTAGLGNVGGTNNILPSQTMTGLTSASTAGSTSNFSWLIQGMTSVTPGGGTIYFNLTASGSPSTGASETLAVDLHGYLV